MLKLDKLLIKLNSMKLSIFAILLLVSLLNNATAGQLTNINETTDLFDKEIEDRNGLESFLEDSKNKAQESIINKEAISTLGVKEEELEKKTSELNSINPNSLESKGQEERYTKENEFYDSLEVDYRDPKIINHKKDTDFIADASEKLMSRLVDGLRDIGVDCKQVKGNKEVEPEYFIEIKKEQQKDTIYNQTMCEELRNQYSCNDSVTLKCTKKGKKWAEWEYKKIKFDGHWIYSNAMSWGYAIKWKYKRWGWHITPYHPKDFGDLQVDSHWKNNPELIIADARRVIAGQLGVSIDQIREDIVFPEAGRGIGETIELGHSQRWRVIFQEYEFGYYYRDGLEICEQWQEDWTERCVLK